MSDIGPVGPVRAGGELLGGLPLPVVDEGLAAGAGELLLVVDEALAAGAGELFARLVTERAEVRSDAALVERLGCEIARRRGA
jgi:hypothetical protein